LRGDPVISRLNELLGGALRLNEPMSAHTSFEIGGPADALLVPSDVAQLKLALAAARTLDIAITVIGNGSNLLVGDGGVRGLVIKLAGTMAHVRVEDTSVIAGCGILLSELSRQTASGGLAGLEFAEGIPGTLGGAVVMNAGAYDGEMAGVVSSVRVLAFDGQEKIMTRDDLAFGYRTSALQCGGLIAVEAALALHPSDRAVSMARIDDLHRRRWEKQPMDVPSAGSAFKRPPGNYAGGLIQQAGLRGYSIGGAQVSPLHAGFIVNKGGATAKDVLALIDYVRSEVRRTSGIELEPEIRVIGDDRPS
jgi:UDP-N-acetylmuramate dehydrogenase